MIEPVDSDHHVASPGLPHALDAADEGQVGAAGGQEHGTVTDTDHLSATDDGLIKELLSFALHTSSLSGFPKPLPELSGGKESRNFGSVLHTRKPLTFGQLLSRGEVDPLSPLWPAHLPLSPTRLLFWRTPSLSGALPGGRFSRFSLGGSGGGRRG